MLPLFLTKWVIKVCPLQTVTAAALEFRRRRAKCGGDARAEKETEAAGDRPPRSDA